MADSSSFLSAQFLPVFIEEYRKHRCLWQVKSKEYSNKNLKAAAYKELVELTIDVIPGCDVDFTKKKIDMIRGNFRRENKKVKGSMKTGSGTDSVYQPKLWYYNLLSFLKEQGEARESTSSLDPPPVSEDEIEESQESASKVRSASPITPPAPSSTYGRKRKAKPESETASYLEKAVSMLEKKEDDCDKFAANVAAKLRKMESLQVIFAENLINQVLYNGMLGRLQEYSTFNIQPMTLDRQSTSTNSTGRITPFPSASTSAFSPSEDNSHYSEAQFWQM